MSGLIESRKRAIAVAALAFGALLGVSCSEDEPETTTNPVWTGDSGLPPDGGVGGTFGGTAGGVAGGTAGGVAGGTAGGGTAGGGTAGGGTAGGGTAGGGTAGGGTAGGTGGGIPCAVKTILDQKCGNCHKNPPAFSAPMPLVTQADFQAAGKSDATKKAHQLVKTRVNQMGAGAMPPPPLSLTAEERQTLNTWLDAGAPASTESCTGGPGGGMTGGGSTDTTGLTCYKFLAHAQGNKNAKYKVGAARDAYMAMGFKAPWTGTVYGQVIKPVVDNDNAIHHWLLYEEATTDGSITSSIGQHAGGELLTGWAPGGEVFDFRIHGDVGIELPATSYVLELHYNSSDPNAEDASGAEVCVKTTKPQHVAAQSWLGWDQLLLPDTNWTGTCSPGHSQPINLLFVTPHMHQAGKHMKAVINGPNGMRPLHDKAFDFAYQVTYSTKEVLMPGESITTSCTFSEPKAFGQATSDEMCYLFTYYYPKGLLVDNGVWGSIAHGEGVCLGQ